jgi:cytochrome c-type biogenesis protein CcmH/NrfG
VAKRPERKKKKLDRTELLAQADKSRARGRRRRAIVLYAKLLEQDPNDLTVHGKIAPLLAAEGKGAAAMQSFRTAAAGQAAAGYPDRGIAVLRQAADHFPEDESLWTEIANLHVLRGRRGDAVAALVAAGERLLSGRFRPIGAKMLRRALELEPWHVQATLLLAKTLARERRRQEAVALLEGLARRTGGTARTRARRLAFWLSPTPGRLWRWLTRSADVQ